MLKKNNDDYTYGKIYLHFDSRIKGAKQEQVVEGDQETVASLIGCTIRVLLENGFDRELLEHAINNGLGKSKKNKIEVKKFQLSDEDAKDFEKLLKKLTGEG